MDGKPLHEQGIVDPDHIDSAAQAIAAVGEIDEDVVAGVERGDIKSPSTLIIDSFEEGDAVIAFTLSLEALTIAE